jgi:transposase
MSKRRNHDAAFEARVAFEALKGERTVSALATYEVHPTMIHQWKKALLEGAAGIFERGGKAAVAAEVPEDPVRDLHAKIGELAVANDFYHESSSHGSGSETRHDQTEPSKPVDRGAVSPAGDSITCLAHCDAVGKRAASAPSPPELI